MRYYSVHAPDGEFDSPEDFVFVKDGFSWPALFVPILWILWHRLWLTLVWYVVFVLVVAWTGRLLGDDVATVSRRSRQRSSSRFEANNIRRLSLEGRGWDEVGVEFWQGHHRSGGAVLRERSSGRCTRRRSTRTRRSRAPPIRPEHRPPPYRTSRSSGSSPNRSDEFR